MSKTLEEIITSPSLVREQWLSPELAVREVLAFERRFGAKHLMLACHAALPLIVTSELVNLIHLNFLEEEQIPWVAEVDFLLSPLCRPIDEGLYEVEPSVREVLLVELENQFGFERPFGLAKFLKFYLAHTSGLKLRSEIIRTQQWIAQAYLDPDKLIEELIDLLESSLSEEDNPLCLPETIQIATTLEMLAEPLEQTNLLTEYRYLVNNSRVLAQILYGNEEELRRRINQKQVEDQTKMGEGNLRLLSPVIFQWLEDLEDTTELRKDSEPTKIQSVTLDLPKFFKACNPSKPLGEKDKQYYIDFSSVRRSDIIKTIKHNIAVISPDEPTCQLFTGHIGCGKSTELLRLKSDLEQEGFHVVYFESSQDIDMADVDVTDILLSIAGQVSESLEAINICLHPGFFANLFTEIADFLQIPIGFSAEAELSINIGKITTKTKESPKLRRRLRQYLEPRTILILHSINEELLVKANTTLKQQGKAGLVVIVDNLDRVDFRPLPSGKSQQEYLFIDRGEQLRKLNCHVVYTIPLGLTFSNDCEILKDRLGGGISPKVLPMVPVKRRNGEEHTEGMELLRQMVMVRAFPDESLEKLPELIPKVFDTPETLNRLCRISGGHLRNLLGLLLGCAMQNDLPFSGETLEEVIRERRDYLLSSIDDDEWRLLFQVMKKQTVRGDIEHNILLRSMFVFEYRDLEGQWFDVNPILAESQKFKSLSRK